MGHPPLFSEFATPPPQCRAASPPWRSPQAPPPAPAPNRHLRGHSKLNRIAPPQISRVDFRESAGANGFPRPSGIRIRSTFGWRGGNCSVPCGRRRVLLSIGDLCTDPLPGPRDTLFLASRPNNQKGCRIPREAEEPVPRLSSTARRGEAGQSKEKEPQLQAGSPQGLAGS